MIYTAKTVKYIAILLILISLLLAVVPLAVSGADLGDFEFSEGVGDDDEFDDSVLPGDVNGDGNINSIDTNILKRYLVGAEVSVVRSNSDLNSDSKIDTLDSNLLRRLVAGNT